MEDEFGATYARSLAHDLALSPLGGRSADDALASGHTPREVWEAVCAQMEVPEERRQGKPARPAPGSRSPERRRPGG